MKLKSIATGIAFLVAGVAAQAGTAGFNLNQTSPGFWEAGYDSDFLVGALLGGTPAVYGTDTITFDDFMTSMPTGLYDVELTFHEIVKNSLPGVIDPINVDLGATNLNGLPIAFASKRTFTIDGIAPHPFVLTLKGSTNYADVGYHGTITVSAVPEPENYAMLLSGLGLMAGIARRRKSKQA